MTIHRWYRSSTDSGESGLEGTRYSHLCEDSQSSVMFGTHSEIICMDNLN